jgi:hypothetical protein
MDDQTKKGKSVLVCHRIEPGAEKLATAKSGSVSRKEGLLKDRVRWTPEAFAPMTEEQVAELDGSSANHLDRPNPI